MSKKSRATGITPPDAGYTRRIEEIKPTVENPLSVEPEITNSEQNEGLQSNPTEKDTTNQEKSEDVRDI